MRLVTAPQERARALFLRHFRWHEGHADLSALLGDGPTLRALGPALVEPFASARPDGVVALEARGFVVGALAAHHLGVGLVLARKPGAVHPAARRRRSRDLDWRGRPVDLAVSATAVRSGARLLVVDDWVETGVHARTAHELLIDLGARPIGTAVLVDDTTDEVRRTLGVVGMVRRHDLPLDDGGDGA